MHVLKSKNLARCDVLRSLPRRLELMSDSDFRRTVPTIRLVQHRRSINTRRKTWIRSLSRADPQRLSSVSNAVRPAGSNSLADAIFAALAGVGLVFAGGILYVKWYKYKVLEKMEQAFSAGYDPALDLASHSNRNRSDWQNEGHLIRREQGQIDEIIQGKIKGSYFMITGPKGAGKSSMILDAMTAINADGVAIVDVHPDPEVFRLRLGRALNYEYNEDSQMGVFQRRDPREGGPGLDIERALNKLEKVALRSSKRKDRPLVLVFNNVHYFKNEGGGHDMLLQLQQRAESWAGSGILTMVFTTDEIWPYMQLRRTATRLRVVSIYDLDKRDSIRAIQKIRQDCHLPLASEQELDNAVSISGGRLAHISIIAKLQDMKMARKLVEQEKAWLMSQVGLIPDHDDDVMDEQKWSTCTWLLLREFVNLREEEEAAGTIEQLTSSEDNLSISVPKIPYWRCRQIMTRPDFLQALDSMNIINIDIDHDVRIDSMMLLHAAREVVKTDGFDQLLDDVRGRVDEIESLHRTRELMAKDQHSKELIRLV